LPDVVARLPQTQAALAYATLQHAGQRRSSDGAPFIEHPIEVGWLLYRAGAPDRVIAAGVLHDVLEKTPVTAGVLRRRFGKPIAKLVDAVSEDPGIASYAQRKAALRQQVAAAGSEALMVFAADKVSKVRELRSAVASTMRARKPVKRTLIPLRRLTHFRRCLGMLEERLGADPLVQLLRAELADLNRELKAYSEQRARGGAVFAPAA
jgi:(p)ppGpp synthase/HD superfamily hydrolase